MTSPIMLAVFFNAHLRQLAAWAARVEQMVLRHMPDGLTAFRREVVEAQLPAARGDFRPLWDVLWDWEATLEEAASGPLEVSLRSLRACARTGTPAQLAVESLLRECRSE
jgi:hypothetical protein